MENDKEREDQSNLTIRNHVLASMGVGLVPIPLVNWAGITGVQLHMLKKLSQIHEIPFTEHKVKTVLSALIGGGSTIPVAYGFYSLVKFIPIIGPTIGAVSMIITSGAITYAVGKVFQMHFATGGTFLSFNPEEVKEYYAEMLKEGKDVAEKLKSVTP